MVEDMAAQLSDENDLQHTPRQGTIFYSSCKKRDFLLTLFLLSSFFGILCFGRKWSEILTGSRGDEAMAGLFFIVVLPVIVIALRIKGTNDRTFKDLVRSVMQIASKTQLLLPRSFGLMISSAHAEQTGSIQSTTLVDPNIWGIREYVKSAAVITLLAGLMAAIIRIARTMINPRRQVAAPILAFYTNPTLQKTRTPFPIIPAISPILGTVPDNAIDDALARTLVPTRSNSPLSWL